MTKSITFLIFSVIVAAVLMSAVTNGNQSPYGKTGSPGDGGDCTLCHSGASTVQNFITSNIPATGYISGKTYTITITAVKSGINKFGFELTAEDASHTKKGTFVITNSTETKMVNDEVSHTGLGTAGTNGQKVWTVDWTPPTAGTGNITFYSAVNAANGDGGVGGDAIILSQLQVQEDPSNAIADSKNSGKISLYPTVVTNDFVITSPVELIKIEIFNTAGKKIKNIIPVRGSNRFTVDVSILPSGIYFAKIETVNYGQTMKFIKK